MGKPVLIPLFHHIFQRFIKSSVLMVGLVVSRLILRIRRMPPGLSHGQGHRLLIAFIKSNAHTGQDCCSQGGCRIGRGHHYRFSGNVGLYLCPQREFAEPPMARSTFASAPASSAVSRLCRRENATPSIRARTMCPLVLEKSSP